MYHPYKIGDVVIAKRTNADAGYHRGDTVQINRRALLSGEFVARNLTRGGEAYIGDFFRGKQITNTETKTVYTVSFLGFPLFKVRKAVDE